MWFPWIPTLLTFFSHPRVDELLEIGRGHFDLELRHEVYSEIQEIIANEAPMVLLVAGDTLVGARSNINGLDLRVTGLQLFYTVYFD